MEATQVKRCGRCLTVLTPDELRNQHVKDRLRCGVCVCTTDIKDFLDFRALPAPTVEEAKAEWVRRVFLAS